MTATQQVAMNVLLHGMSAGDAVAAPRIHHQAVPEVLRVEKVAPLDEELQDELRTRGHVIEPIYNVANVQAIHVDRDSGRRLQAASDPRKGGRPAGRSSLSPIISRIRGPSGSWLRPSVFMCTTDTCSRTVRI